VSALEVAVAIALVVGAVGVVVPLLPGAVLVVVALLVWALAESSVTGWVAFALAVAVVGGGQVLKYAVPGRHLQRHGVPNRSLVAGGLLGIVGFFAIPVVGLLVGFVVGIYVSELQRVGRRAAWPSTRAALRATGLSMLIELASTLIAAAIWLAAVVAT
jgi:uncharacterized protein YqgC (DUF456 family)